MRKTLMQSASQFAHFASLGRLRGRGAAARTARRAEDDGDDEARAEDDSDNDARRSRRAEETPEDREESRRGRRSSRRSRAEDDGDDEARAQTDDGEDDEEAPAGRRSRRAEEAPDHGDDGDGDPANLRRSGRRSRAAEDDVEDEDDGDRREGRRSSRRSRAEEEDDGDDDEREMRGNSAAAKARRRERERCEAIVTSAYAARNPDLAIDLAFNTDLTRAQAISTLRRQRDTTAEFRSDDRRRRNPDLEPGGDGPGARTAAKSGWASAWNKVDQENGAGHARKR